jgi:hypothetical protein
MEIEINGVKYQQKQQNFNQSMGFGKISTMLMGMSMMFSAQGSLLTSRYERPTPKVNLVKEFELIQLKKSLLSKKDRDLVVREFNRNFELI